MTDITLSSGHYMRPFRSRNGGSFPVRQMGLSTGSTTIRLGTVVGLDQNSTLGASLIAASSVTSNALVSTAIVGVAAAGVYGSTNDSGTLIPVWEADPQVEFRANTGHGTLNSTLLGTVHAIFRDSTLNIDLVDVGASCLSTPILYALITGLIDAPGDSGGAVSFRFVSFDPNSSLSTGRRLAFFV